MDLTQIPLFAMLRDRMGYLAQRQRLIAENVANADTPGYLPRDLKPFSFQAQMAAGQAGGSAAAGPTMTHAGHMSIGGGAGGGSAGGARFKPVGSRDSETTLDGNGVVLEDQMLKMTDARMSYDAAIGFYQKSLNLLRMASRAPGH